MGLRDAQKTDRLWRWIEAGGEGEDKTPRVSSRFPAGPVGRKGLPFAETGRGLGSGVRS